MGGSTPQPDWTKLQEGITASANQQTANNRPTQNTPFAKQSWAQDQNGNWTQNTAFAPGSGLEKAANGLQNQIGLMGQPMDWSQFGKAGTGDDARNQATAASYNQATSRLDPQWNQREDANRTRLLNQGLDPSSQAFRDEMGQFGMQRNDAYGSAENNAQMMGQQAGDSVFRNNMMSRQSAIADALRQREQPMQELAGLQGYLGMPGFNQDNSTLPGALGSAQFAQQAFTQQDQARQASEAATAEGIGGGAAIAGSLVSMLAMFY